ncbi:helix-turn-helix domain-containing protein [Aquimarina spongiae]|uniref:Helix-turn-helix domain-containing protein n=1 Tax=Aquimarina spongiae TaxID=570521 RepID=A0A1M6KZL8_9FLAO|nr:helix-turn-helix transcriptional regulator [Aquimarina spongiae]SHJ64425.1 Helix-turn-helix domain-containing protein [Aquimarina spongiae]
MNNLNLKEIRKKLRFTQAKMAEELGLSLRGYQNWEQGDRKIPKTAIETVNRLLDNNKKSYKNTQTAYYEKAGVKFDLNDAIKLIFDNIKEAEKMPLMQMYKETIEQRAIMEEREQMYQKMLKSKQKDETQD